ncbi:MAG: metal-dependent transcriptional regulator [Proteobacteria bacterium]|nr:metal-dependent transcriptional regulator [Pseudomonadota bacterium]
MKARASVVVEEYLQVIYSLISDNKPVKAVSLANWMKTSPSTVHATLSRLQRDNLITIGRKKEIDLTSEGLSKAEGLTRRHRLVESFLCDTLGISWHEVHNHAHILEHGLTPLVEAKLAEFLGFPKACPHGTPIPGENSRLPEDMIYLDKADVGKNIKIIIIDETLEESTELMKFLQEKNIVPGKIHRVVEKQDVTKTIIVESNEIQAILPFDVADKIGVVVQPW